MGARELSFANSIIMRMQHIRFKMLVLHFQKWVSERLRSFYPLALEKGLRSERAVTFINL